MYSQIALSAEKQIYSFGIVPQQSATRLARTWIPVLQQLQQEAGISLRFATAPDIPTFEKRLAAGEYDFSYMNPYHYTVFHQSPGYRAIARQADKQINGILVVKKDSGIKKLSDLQGKVIAFPAPAAFAATLLVSSNLKQSGIDFTAKYVSSHDSVYRSVAQDFVSAGGGITRTYESIDPEVRSHTRILWKSKGYTPHAIAAHPRVPSEEVARLQTALQSLSLSEPGRAALENINFTAVVAAQDSDWDDVRDLQIDILSPQE